MCLLVDFVRSFVFVCTGVDKIMKTIRNCEIGFVCVGYIERTSVGSSECTVCFTLCNALVGVFDSKWRILLFRMSSGLTNFRIIVNSFILITV
jgi:hypothetical protein